MPNFAQANQGLAALQQEQRGLQAFKDAVVGRENSVAGVLRESKDVLRDMAQTFPRGPGGGER